MSLSLKGSWESSPVSPTDRNLARGSGVIIIIIGLGLTLDVQAEFPMRVA